tara:strand:+ start:38180 stop:38872 length:693 start_codon:yes stop_codon:yes gene_type:complete
MRINEKSFIKIPLKNARVYLDDLQKIENLIKDYADIKGFTLETPEIEYSSIDELSEASLPSLKTLTLCFKVKERHYRLCLNLSIADSYLSCSSNGDIFIEGLCYKISNNILEKCSIKWVDFLRKNINHILYPQFILSIICFFIPHGSRLVIFKMTPPINIINFSPLLIYSYIVTFLLILCVSVLDMNCHKIINKKKGKGGGLKDWLIPAITTVTCTVLAAIILRYISLML